MYTVAEKNAYQRMWMANQRKKLIYVTEGNRSYWFAPNRDGLHGPWTYQNYGCRCDACSTGMANYRAGRK